MADSPDFKFVFFNVGQGDATLVSNLKTFESILVDTKRSDCIIQELEDNKYLLRAIFVTHWDADHVDGVPSLLHYLRERREQIQFFSHKQSKKNEAYKKFRSFLDEAKEDNTFQVLEHNDFIFTSKTPPNNHYQLIGIDIIILWPENSPPIPEGKAVNIYSVVLKIIIGGKNILLLPGDASGDCWDKIETEKLNAVIFKYPHHGGHIGNNINAKELIEKVNPKKVVVSYGKNNSYGHPITDFKKAKAQLSNKIEFYDTTGDHIVIHYDSIKNVLF